MFNAGIIGSKSPGPLVKLTSRFVGFAAYPQILFRHDGQIEVPGLGFIAGEWYVPGMLAGIGSSYQIRYTLMAGTSPVSGYADVVGVTWTDIYLPSYGGRRVTWDEGASGRVLIEIRDKATQVVKAAAQFWSKASSAP